MNKTVTITSFNMNWGSMIDSMSQYFVEMSLLV